MQFTNSFEVSLPPDQAWPLLMDIESIVPCMPGAEIVEVIDEMNFKGKVAVRLGPVALVFVCDIQFEEINNDARVAKAKASGADAKGRGTAAATIDFRCQPSAVGSKILISTDLALSGAVAQYGRGVGLIQNVANQIIGHFSSNLEKRISQLKDHGIDFGRSAKPEAEPSAPSPAAASDSSVAPKRAERAPQVSGGDYAQGYKEGFAAGFAAGHAAGYAIAGQLGAQHSRVPGAQASGRAGLPPFPPAKPIGGLSLIFSSLWATVRGWFVRGTA